MSHRREPEQIKNHQLEELICQNRLIIRLLSIIAAEDAPLILSSIKIQFSKGTPVPTAGPVTLTTAGQQVTASVLGFDQFGQPFTGPMPHGHAVER